MFATVSGNFILETAKLFHAASKFETAYYFEILGWQESNYVFFVQRNFNLFYSNNSSNCLIPDSMNDFTFPQQYSSNSAGRSSSILMNLDSQFETFCRLWNKGSTSGL